MFPAAGYTSRARYSNGDDEQYDPDAATRAKEKRQKATSDEYQRLRDNPTAAEIQSGKALNILLSELQGLTSGIELRDLPAVELTLDPQALQHINVSQGAGSVGVLKNGSKLSWPAALSGPEFQDQRAQVSEHVQGAVKQARADGRVDAAAIAQLTSEVEGLRNQLRQNAPSVSFAQHVEAKNFLSSLDAAIVGLEQRDVGNYFNGKYSLQAKTAPELVKQMTQEGLRFAAAASGDEAAYKALYQNLAGYYRSLVSEGRPVPPVPVSK